MSNRSKKLTKLQTFFDLETGRRNKEAFFQVDTLFEKAIKKKALDLEIRNCTRCPGMNQMNMTEAAVGWGNLNAKIMLIGQSLCTVCMNTGIPFTRGSGYLVDAALMLADLQRIDVFITNVVHCHPPHNRPSEPKEIRNCKRCLITEIDIVKPEIIITLGADARIAFTSISEVIDSNIKIHNVRHPAYFLHAGFEGAIDWIISLATKMEKYNGNA